jgi:hypothetical protein
MLHNKVRIQGFRKPDTNEIWVNGKKLNPADSLKLSKHSLDGFNWGYGGSGPSQAALGICLAVTQDPDLALEIYQPFKWSFVCYWPVDDDFNVTIDFQLFLHQHPDQVQLAKERKSA